MHAYIICPYVAIVHHPYCYGFVLTYSLLWLPIAFHQCYLVFYTQPLYYTYQVFIIIASMFLSLCCLLHLICLYQLTYSFISCLGYMAIQSAMPKQFSKFPIDFYAHLVIFCNIELILSNRIYSMEFIVSSHTRCKKKSQVVLWLHFELKNLILINSDITELTLTVYAIMVYHEKIFN